MTLHFKSVLHPKCPEIKGIVRSETIISGYIMEPIYDSNGKILATNITIVT